MLCFEQYCGHFRPPSEYPEGGGCIMKNIVLFVAAVLMLAIVFNPAMAEAKKASHVASKWCREMPDGETFVDGTALVEIAYAKTNTVNKDWLVCAKKALNTVNGDPVIDERNTSDNYNDRFCWDEPTSGRFTAWTRVVNVCGKPPENTRLERQYRWFMTSVRGCTKTWSHGIYLLTCSK